MRGEVWAGAPGLPVMCSREHHIHVLHMHVLYISTYMCSTYNGSTYMCSTYNGSACRVGVAEDQVFRLLVGAPAAGRARRSGCTCIVKGGAIGDVEQASQRTL